MKNRKILLIVLLLVCIAVGAVILFPLFSSNENGAIETGGELVPETPPVPVEIEIICVGDVMGHATQIKAQLLSDGTYDFANNFKYVKEYIQAADLAICNVETTFGGEPYTGYPAFSSPDALADALADAGFDVASTANNHMVDRGLNGLLRTLEVLHGRGLKTTGSVIDPTDENEPRYAMHRVKDVDIAVIGYTYQTPTNNGSVAINGSVLSNELASHINSFGYSNIDQELAKINDTVVAARNAGADIVILFYHWGEEYQLSANKWQRYMAEKTVEMMDVDVIFGSHPHVLQEAEMFTKIIDTASNIETLEMREVNGTEGSNAEDDTSYEGDLNTNTSDGTTLEQQNQGTKQIPVFFSLGNFISNQRAETLDNRYTEEGVIAKVNISIMAETGEIQWVKMSAIPTWVDRHKENGKYYYHIIPLDEKLQTNETLAVSGHLNRAERAWEDANGLLKIN